MKFAETGRVMVGSSKVILRKCDTGNQKLAFHISPLKKIILMKILLTNEMMD
jgi:hypothetical protein